MTTVAEVKRPEITAREEATTAMEGMLAVAMFASVGGGLLFLARLLVTISRMRLDEWSVVATREDTMDKIRVEGSGSDAGLGLYRKKQRSGGGE
jgi:hypothetical protein